MSNFRAIIKPALTLAVICIVVTALLAAVNLVTSPIIARAEEKAAAQARAKMLSEADSDFKPLSLSEMPEGVSEAYRAVNGSGYVFIMLTKGYGGDIKIICGIRSDGTLEAVQTLKHSETSGIGTRVVADEGYYSKYFGKTADSYTEVDAVSGATISSKAYKNAVKTAFETFAAAKEAEEK